jgi:hypothetical protein
MKNFILLLLILLLVSCKGGVLEVAEEGHFEATVGDPVSTTFRGRAMFGTFTDPAGGGEGALIQLLTGGERGISLTGKVGGVPGVGEYTIVRFDESRDFRNLRPNEFFGLYVHGSGTEFSLYFNSRSGSIFITHSSNDLIKGTFSFTAEGYRTRMDTTRDTVTVTLSGSFEARKGTVEFR